MVHSSKLRSSEWYIYIMLIETEQRSKANSHRLDSVQNSIDKMKEENKAIYKIATSVEVMAEKLGNIEDKVDETKRKVDETAEAQRASEERLLQRVSDVENAPAKQTASNVNSIRLSIVTAVVTFLVTGVAAALVYFAK